MKLEYQIELLSDWHVGSGLDSTTNVNALVLKDENDLPYLPGKTIKGLMKDAFWDLYEVGQCELEIIYEIFGKNEQDRSSGEGRAFFSNAGLPQTEKSEILDHQLMDYLYRNIASTAIEKTGLAKTASLRVRQVTIPIGLRGYISGLKDWDEALLEKAGKLIRHLGGNRNRGLGRCRFSLLKNPSS